MNHDKLFYRNSDKLDEMNVVDIIKLAIEFEIKEMHRYEKLENSIDDEGIRNEIKCIRIDEEKHLKLLQQMYYQTRANFVKLPRHEAGWHESIRELLKECIEEELELVSLYIRLQSMIPIPIVKGVLYEIIMDEQSHASRMISIYARNFNNQCVNALTRIPVTAATKYIKSKDELIEVDLRIPVISGIENKNVEQLINRSIENDIMEFKRQMEMAAKEGSEEAKAQGQTFIPYIISTNYAITFDRNNILSISIIYHEYVGGRHVYIRASYNFDIRTGKSLGLREIFKPGVPYVELINAEIKRQIQANPNIYPQDAADSFKGIAADQPYYLEGENIVINLGFHQLAPTVAEIPVIRIPISKFRNQLRPEYFG